MNKIKTSRNTKGFQDLATRPRTTGDTTTRKVPLRTVRNIRRGHLTKGMRDINHAYWKQWEQQSAEGRRLGEQLRFNRANQFYDTLESVNRLLSAVRQRESELQASREQLAISYEELEATNEELATTSEELERIATYRQTLMDTMVDILMTTDPDGIITEVNRATESISGYSRDVLIGRPFHQFFADPEQARNGIEKVLAEGRVSNYALILNTKGRQQVAVSYNATVQRDPNGAITGVLGNARDVTEQMKAEEALRLASAYNRSLIEASLDPLVTINTEGQITDVNVATEKVTGYTRAELIDTDFSDYFTDPEQARAGYEQVFREGFVQDYALEIRHRSGQMTPVLYNASVYQDEAGEVVGVFAAARDITEQVKAEEAVRVANAYNRSLIEASLDPLVTIDTKGKVTDVNAATEKVTGYTRAELIDTDFSDYFTDPEQARAGYEQAFREGFVQDYALKIRHRGGQITPVLYNASVYRDEAGEVAGVFAAARDIAEQVKAEDAARIANAYNRSLIEASLDPLVTIDTEGKVTDVNAATEKVTGYTRAELIDTDFSDYFTDPEQARAGYEQVFREGFVQDYALEIRHRSGQMTPVLYNASVYQDEAGEVVGVFAAARDITEQVKAEDSARVANAYNRSLIDASLDPLVTIDTEGKVTDVNAATEKVTGYARAELIDTDFSDYFTDPEQARAGYEQAFREGFVQDYALEIRHRSGQMTPVLYNASVYRDEAGEVVGVFAAARDITERRRAEEANLRLVAIVESSDDAIVGKTLDGTITSWNIGSERLYGFSAKEIVGQSISILVPHDRQDEVPDFLGKVKQGIPLEHYETVRVRKDGTPIDVSVKISPIKDVTGKITGASSIARDITKQVRAEEAVRVANAYNRSLIEASLDPLVTINARGKITDVNAATEEVTGYTRAELIDTDFSDYFTEPEQARAGYEQAFREGFVQDYALEIQHRSGQMTPVLYNASVYRDEVGEVVGVFAAARDITERIQSEKEIVMKSRDLETLLYVISHDLNEPLRAIENFSQMVHDQYTDKIDARGQDFLRRIVLGTGRLRNLLSDLLMLSRAQRITLPTEEVDGKTVVREALERLSTMAKRTDAKITVAPALPQLRADKTWVTQAVYNLIANALKFTGKGVPPEIEIAPYQPGPGSSGDEVGIVVRDRGPGVTPEHSERIFQLFQRAVGREIEGTGAGLAIVRQVAERHGGRAWVQPRKGGGSEFIITFNKFPPGDHHK
jgi:PAS domain S-box-containing protein